MGMASGRFGVMAAKLAWLDRGAVASPRMVVKDRPKTVRRRDLLEWLNPQIWGHSARARGQRAYTRAGVENRRVGVGSIQAPVALPN
ncbi:hypothetical protein EMIT0111MI5_60028 [Burkholderia sp. IT-111MI5]